MLDTNMVSYIIRGKSQSARLSLESLQPEEIAGISVITEAELRFGLAKVGGGSAARGRALDWFLNRLTVYDWNRQVALVYGDLRAKLEAQGRMLGPLDMQIAAHAITIGATLVTRDKAFQQVTDLLGILNWATDL
jgi:tRNA(fMet)-specific endonuclease VapC